MLAFAGNSLFKDLLVNFLSLIHILLSYGFDPLSILILQQEETKILVLDANLLGNVDLSLPRNLIHSRRVGWSA